MAIVNFALTMRAFDRRWNQVGPLTHVQSEAAAILHGDQVAGVLQWPRCRSIAGQEQVLRWAARNFTASSERFKMMPERRLRSQGPAREIVAEARFARPFPMTTGAKPGIGARPRHRRRISAPALATGMIVTISAAAMAIVAEKERVVRALPPSAAMFAALGLPVNLRGLTLDEVRSTLAIEDGRSILTVQGRVSNVRGVPIALPSLRLAVRDVARQELYTWTARAQKTSLAAGETVVFRSRLASPPDNGHDLLVGFTETSPARP